MSFPRSFTCISIWKHVALLLLAAQGVFLMRATKLKCDPFEYYDEHVDNCAPCSEICDHREVTKTEKQCYDQCSDYLIASTCTYNQYYDDVIENCAHCSDICLHSERKQTTEQCNHLCKKYLIAKNCTVEEYFNVHEGSCLPCADLCSLRDSQGNTTQDCFHQCTDYIAKYPPGNIVQDPIADTDRSGKAKASTTKDFSSSSKMHPGLIVAIVIGIVAIAISVVGLVAYKRKTKRPKHQPVPTVEAHARETYGVRPADGAQVEIQMENLINNLEEQPSSSDTASVWQRGEAPRPIQEQNPHASSSHTYIENTL